MTTPLVQRLIAECDRREAEWTRSPTLNPPTKFVHHEPIRALLREAAEALAGREGEITVSPGSEREARDLFARELERDGIEFLPGEIRSGGMLTIFEQRAIRAIQVALSLVPAAGPGNWLVCSTCAGSGRTPDHYQNIADRYHRDANTTPSLAGGGEVGERPHATCIAFKEGMVWNFTNDPELAQEWCDRGVAECWAKYESTMPLRYAQAVAGEDHGRS